MNSDLLSQFGKMFPDYSQPALAALADAAARDAERPPARMMNNATFAAARNFTAEFYQRIEARTSMRSFPRLGQSGLMERGDCLTLNTSEWPSAEEGSSVCSLSEILEPHVAPKYLLSKAACQGILRRAEKRGKKLPEHLEAALRAVAEDQRT